MTLVLEKLSYLLNRRERWQLLFVFVLMVVGAALEMLAVGAIPAFVSLLSHPDVLLKSDAARVTSHALGITSYQQFALLITAGVAVLFISKNGYLALLASLQADYTRRSHIKIASRLFRAYLYGPYTFHLQRNTAELLRNVSDDAQRAVVELLMPGMQLVMEVLVLVAVLLLLVSVEPVVSLVALLMLGTVSVIFYWAVRQNLSKIGLQQQHYRRRMLQSIHQGLGGIKIAKVLRRERYFADAFTGDATGYAQALKSRSIINQLPLLFIETIGVLGLLAIAGVLIMQGRPMAGIVSTLTLLAVAFVRLIPAFTRITVAITWLRYARYAVDVVYNDLRLLEREGAPTNGEHRIPFSFRFAIAIDDLHYRYPGAAETALNGLSLEIQRGSAVAFVGPSGAGKTTIVNLILGLLEPTHGSIRVDEMDIQNNLGGWQRQIGYVPQEIYLSDDTIRRNVAFGIADDEIIEEQVLAAIESAQLRELVERLPKGLDTMVGERGMRLSGGQCQRIGIARALYHDPSVLVMDEATSHLDNETERYIMEAVERLRGDRTVIIIAHRLSTVRNCDRLFFIKCGRLASVGTYDQLVDENDRFRLVAV